MNWFTVAYLVLGLAVLVVELWGVVRRRRFDTISEHWWWLQKRLPWIRIVYLAFTIWLALHLLWHWP